jgi:glycosyltransferase involved in cell wall biosynthesis
MDQSAENWELIIVDDGSIDDTKIVVRGYLNDERIICYYQRNAGVSAARNKGVELSKGDYIIFLDSDDRISPSLISTLNKINYQKYDLICWQVSKLLDGKTSILKPRRLEKIYNNMTATFLSGSICYRKNVVLEAGGFDPRMSFGENYELGMRIGEIPNLKIRTIAEPLLEYRFPLERESNSYTNRLNSYLHLYQKHLEKFEEDKISHSRMNYLLGYIHEKTGSNEKAFKYFKEAFKISNRNYKAFLKFIYFIIFRR